MKAGSIRQTRRRSDARSGQGEALQPSIDRAFGPSTGQPMTRRRFLGRAAALGISASALGLSLDGCGASAEPSRSAPAGTSGRGEAAVHPTPKAATYGAMLEAIELAVGAMPSGGLRALLDEVAAGVGIAVSAAAAGRRQARLTVTADDPSIVSQGYCLEVAAGNVARS